VRKLLHIFLITLSTISYSQTAITNANIQTAVDLWDSDLSAATTTYGNISDWDVSQVTDMSQLFYHNPDFNYDIRNWDVSNVTDMRQMFYEASSFNQPIGNWDVSSVTDMSYMFYYATSLNQDISNWDVGNVTDMVNMFGNAESFNQPIGNWDVSSVIAMGGMFYYTSAFNQPIGDWNVSSVTDMGGMFYAAESFNQPIGNWDVSSVTDMGYMFSYATSFNHNISSWCVTNISSEPTDFSVNSPLIEIYKPVWGTCPSFGLDDQNQLDISIYPNPVIDKLFIQGLSNPTKISVYNLLGKLVLSKTTSSEINVDNLQSGIYIIKIVDEQKEIIRKFIKN
jgi:surface protein